MAFKLVSQSNNNSQNNHDTDLLDETQTKEPVLYKVIVLNDDYTPMDFVIYVLKIIFGHNDLDAEKIMLDIHKKGAGLAGVYTFEIAETKSYAMNQLAKDSKYPLKSIIEEDV